MNPHIAFRLGIDAALMVCVFFGWWYVALPLGLIGLFRFSYFAEFTLAGFVYDALFGMGGGVSAIAIAAGYAGTLATATLSLVVAAIKSSLR